MLHAPHPHQPARDQLAAQAEALQAKFNGFIGLATMAGVQVPDSLYEANAGLLYLLRGLRAIAPEECPEEHPQEATICGD